MYNLPSGTSDQSVIAMSDERSTCSLSITVSSATEVSANALNQQ